MSWYVQFDSGAHACVCSPKTEAAAMELATQRAAGTLEDIGARTYEFAPPDAALWKRIHGAKAIKAWRIPYPAAPMLEPDLRGCPPFCHDPKGQCRGRSCCPKSYACSE